MTELGFQAFDADQHYYEAEDAFTRHLDPAMRKRCMQWAEIDGRKRLLVGGRVNRFIPNPTFDPVASLDAQKIEACFMFPTLGVGMESALEHDVPAMLAAFRSFNRWLEEDWGCNFQDRIYSAPYITLADVDWAIEELEWALSKDARIINLRASSVIAPDGRRSLGHPLHDAFWQKVNDAGITICIHSGDAGYGFMLDYWGQESEFEAFRYSPLRSLLTTSPISDAVASFIGEGIFARFPNLRLATIESGSEWVGPLFKKLKKAYGQHNYAFAENPLDTFRKHVWVSPYYEDDLIELREQIGAEHILFGSDWPHAEGLEHPIEFIHDLEGFNPDEIRLIMRENALGLVTKKGAMASA
jgi:predicted TIM-barrel fold metal-dependent hydrolase